MARRRLTKALFEFCDRGSEDEIAMRDNRAALDRIKLLPRVLNDVSGRDPGITLFGRKHALPLLIGPTGIAGWVWYRAEIELARAAAHAGIPFTLASTSSTAMEKVLAEGGGTQWFQLYVWRDVEAALVTVARARDAGFAALVLTVDSPTYNNREFDIRNGANFPPRVTLQSAIDALGHPRWLFGTLARYLLAEGRLPRFPNIHFPPEAGAREGLHRRQGRRLHEPQRHARLGFPEAAARPLAGQARGQGHPASRRRGDGGRLRRRRRTPASNYGGRNLDASVAAPIQSCPRSRPASATASPSSANQRLPPRHRRDQGPGAGRGFRHGGGRPTLYGAAAAARPGAYRALEIYREEIGRIMANLGVRDIASLGRDHIVLPGQMPSFGGAEGGVAVAAGRALSGG